VGELAVEDVDVLGIRSGRTDLGMTLTSRWMSQRSTTWATDLPKPRTASRRRAAVHASAIGARRSSNTTVCKLIVATLASRGERQRRTAASRDAIRATSSSASTTASSPPPSACAARSDAARHRARAVSGRTVALGEMVPGDEGACGSGCCVIERELAPGRRGDALRRAMSCWRWSPRRRSPNDQPVTAPIGRPSSR
jgi:hypothetical protein